MPREYPSAPTVGVGAVVIRDNRILLIRRGTEPNRGLWSIPGGVVELGESLALAAEREVREECQVQIRAASILSTGELIDRDEQGRVRYHYILIDMLAHWISGNAVASSDAMDVLWANAVDLESIPIVPRVLIIARSALWAACTTPDGVGLCQADMKQ